MSYSFYRHQYGFGDMDLYVLLLVGASVGTGYFIAKATKQ